MTALQNVAAFLVESLFSLYIGAVLLRFLLAWSRGNFYNPLSQFLVKITNPVLVPLRRVIPAIGKLDTAAIVLAVGLKVIQSFLLVSIKGGDVGLPSIIAYSAFDLLDTVTQIYIFALIIQALMSWVGNGYGNPMVEILNNLTEPLLRPIRKLIPMVGMIDLSPMVAIMGLYVVSIVLKSVSL